MPVCLMCLVLGQLSCPLTFLHHGSDCGARLVYLGTVCHVTRKSGVPGCRYTVAIRLFLSHSVALPSRHPDLIASPSRPHTYLTTRDLLNTCKYARLS
ncbi:hypothetical protein EDB89DRAFT_953422 [Lactarius sanguifluus]|nr:hypothetical protein EDB89DRAFT_953422 [Lactarius sanguifluus]